ncbi:hypothetical protein NON00_14335 [Roseomonas sp. GC11]|uniref:hypothetical protein n=1 Tax=Roseomonas sp. GC11 TaxID=2950546 RepID=UPI00210B92FC|nr:hypothetical protein [Roseomonas sp. GC11]MCQ4161099.1 hypothetical protein [Roseomonas sp. GC11]
MTDAPAAGNAPDSKAAGHLFALARPMQHALNNLFMVLQANLDSVLASLPPEDRAAVRLQRASQGAKDMEALLRAYLRIGRPAEQSPLDSGKFLDAVRPVLAQAAGKPLPVEKRATATIVPPRPAVDVALIDLAFCARALPTGVKPALVLDGATLIANWAASEAVVESLEALGLSVARGEEETRVTLV